MFKLQEPYVLSGSVLKAASLYGHVPVSASG